MPTASLPSAPIDDCWNRIGVAGDQSCPLLARHVHCRNCTVYADAAQRNLQRPVDAAYRREWSEHFRQPNAGAAAPDRAALVFRVGREWLALPAAHLVTIAPAARPHVLPHRNAAGLSGIVNVSGALYPCMSLADLLGIDDSDAPAAANRHIYPRLLVMRWRDQSFALAAAEVQGVLRYAASAAQPPAATINKGLRPFLSGVIAQDELRIGCLDAARLGEQLTRALR